MKMSRMKLIELWNLLNNQKLSQTSGSIKFTYWIASNKSKISLEVTAIKETIETRQISEKYIEFDKKRIEISSSYANKDETDNFITIKGPNGNDIFTFTKENKISADRDIDILATEYKEAIEEFKNQEKEVNDFMKEDIDVELKSIKLDIIPDNIFNTNDIELLLLLGLIEE